MTSLIDTTAESTQKSILISSFKPYYMLFKKKSANTRDDNAR